MPDNDINARMKARRERVEAAEAKASGNDEAPLPDEDETKEEAHITDYWKLPKTAGRTTILNSAWTWTLMTYVAIMAIAVLSISQNGGGLLDSQSNTARIAIAAGLIYPAWRIGSLISKFLKKREFGADISIGGAVSSSVTGKAKSTKAAKPGSVEARMEERRARLEKARAQGKI